VGWIFKFFLIFLVLALILTGCRAPAPQPEPTPVKAEKVLTLLAGEPTTLDPQIANDTLSAMYIVEIYSGLLTLVPVPEKVADQYIIERELPVLTPGIIEKMPKVWQEWVSKKYLKKGVRVVLAPDLAKEIPQPIYNPDGTVSYIFEIRENAKFHNGKEVKAKHFKFSLERAADPRGPDKTSPFTLPTCDLYLSDIVGVKDKMYGRAKEIKGVEVLGERTLKITIDHPKSYFLWKLTYPTAFVLDPDKIVHPRTGKPLDLDWTSRPNATGPFKLVEKTFERIVLEKNENFYLDPPLIDKVIFNLEGGDAITFYQRGEIDLVGIGREEIERLHEFKGEYFLTPEFGTFYIGFHTQKPPFDDINLRKAFAYSIDSKKIVKKVLKGLLSEPQGILPPGIPGYRPQLKGIPFDPIKAREFLKSCKYYDQKTGKIMVEGKEYKIALTRSGRGPSPGDVTAAILDMWKTHLGIEVELRTPLGFSAFQDELRLGQFDLFIHGWVADYPDPEDFLDLLFHSERKVENRVTRYKNPEVDRLLNLARVEQDHEKRIKIYHQVEDLIMKDLPWIPLFYSKNSVMVSPRVKGYYPLPMVIPIFRYIDIVD